MSCNRYLLKVGFACLLFMSAANALSIGTNVYSVNETLQNNRAFKGTVTDPNGEPLIGATIKIKGTDSGTVTDLNGNFVLRSSRRKATIEVSYVGYQSKSVEAEIGKSISISLNEDSEMLDDVVVIGYGTVRKEALTGSVASVSGKALAGIPVASAAEAMVGKLAGVQITTADGSPDAEIQVRVRGGGSITQDNSPLYIVDGFPVDNLNDIAPTDIESIDVLKDASSTAVYGARGANGVVVITTKRAKEGRATITFNAYTSVRTASNKLDVLDPYEFVLLYYEANKLKSSDPTSYYNKYGVPEEFHIYKDHKGDDWQDEIMGKSTISQYYNVTIGGSSGKTRYNLSMTHSNAPSVLAGNGQKKTFLNFKMSTDIFKFLTFEYNTRYVNTLTEGAGTDAVKVLNALEYAPTQGLYDFMTLPEEDPNYDPSDEDYIQRYNPLQEASQNWRRKGATTFNTTAALSLKLFKGLVFRTEFGLDLSNTNYDKRFYGPKHGNAEKYGDGMPYIEMTTNSSPKYRLTNTLSYQFDMFKKNHFNLMIGQELNHQQTSSQKVATRYFPVDITPEAAYDNMTMGEAYLTESSKTTPNRMASFFGRIMYDYDRRYYATITLRADGSTKFAPGNQWGFFPAASLAWRISEEDFLKNNDWVSNLKLRIGSGIAGNNRIGDDMWKTTYKLSTSKTPGWGEVINSYYGYGSSYMPNPSLKWEKTITNNLGIDFGFFNNRLTGTLDLYLNKTVDLLVPSTIPQTTGYEQMQTNVGSTQNKGIELTLNSLIVNTKDFSLSGNFNIGINQNKILSLNSGETVWYKKSGWASTDQLPNEDYLVLVGESVGLMYGYTNDGFYQVDDFDYNPTTGKYILKPGIVDCSTLVSLMPGAPKFKKIAPVDENEVNPKLTTDDLSIIGRAVPKFSGGFGFNATYKGFDASLFFNYQVGNDVYNGNKMHLTSWWRNNNTNQLTLVDSKHRFRYFDDEGNDLRTNPEQLKEFNKNATMWNPTTVGTAIMMSYNVEDGSFLRLNTVTLGYTLPKYLTTKAGISNLRFYVTGYNIWTLTRYTGYDPEVNVMNGLTPGIDCNRFPRSKTYTFGVNLTF